MGLNFYQNGKDNDDRTCSQWQTRGPPFAVHDVQDWSGEKLLSIVLNWIAWVLNGHDLISKN